MSRYSIEKSVDFFDYWKKIMDDIGYDPDDADSFTDESDKPKKSIIENDYDFYWKTRWEHLCREMHDYCYHGRRDRDRLRKVKEQIDVFDSHNVELPAFYDNTRGGREVVDIRAEIRRHFG